MKQVKFMPWVGRNYKRSHFGKRILVLGESHYCANESDATADITQRVIADLCSADSEFEPYKNTYTKFACALDGKQHSWNTTGKVWDEVAFYNYVQFPISGARIAPTNEQFLQSESAFWEVLEELRPEVIIVWGKRLYNHLPKTGTQGLDCGERCEVETWIYQLNDGSSVRVLPITHPSAAFKPEYWHRIFVDFQRVTSRWQELMSIFDNKGKSNKQL